MNKKKMILCASITAVMIIMAVAVVIAVILKRIEQNANVSVFYKEPVRNTLAEVKINITQNDTEQMVSELLERIKSVPQNSELVSALNDDVGFLGNASIDMENKAVTVNLSPSYYKLSDTDALFTKLSITWSLTSLDFIDDVYIMVNGEPLKDTKGEVFGAFNRSNTVINHSIQPYNTERRIIKLYFLEKNGLGLILETREIEVKQNLSLEYQIVEQLIAGSENKDCISIIPKDTKIRNIETKEGTCYVDLTSEFLSSKDTESKEMFMIYSIVNSLTELSHISKVQFLIEGKKAENLKSVSDFSKTYERDESSIVSDINNEN